MKSEYRGIIAIALSAAVFFIWQHFSPPPQPSTAASAPVAQTQTVSTPVAAATAPTAAQSSSADVPDPQAKLPVKEWVLKNNLVEVTLTNDGAVPVSWKTLGWHQSADVKSPLIDLATGDPNLSPPLTLAFEDSNFAFPKRPRFNLISANESQAVFGWRSSEVEIKKTITLRDNDYLADISVEIKNLTSKPVTGRPSIFWSGVEMPVEKGGIFGFLKQPSVDVKNPVFYINGSVKRENNLAKLGPKSEQVGAVLWSGIENRYFLGTIIPRVQAEGLSVEYGVVDLGENEQKEKIKGLWSGAALPKLTVTAGEVSTATFSVYAGPKEINKLKTAGVKLEEAIDYGWFTVVAVPILYLLKFFYGVINNYGVAIILLTIFVKLLLHPINVKSLKSMKAMQQLQPRLKELQQKFKTDKQRLQQETMLLFKAHKVNPMGGCLPMLLQFPIYIALYKVLWNSIELFHAPFFWFYKDLSAPDPYLITPILLGIFMVAQQKLMPNTSADPAQQKMMMLMPIMFSVFMLFLPAGLVIYILINTATSVVQQKMYNKGIGFLDIVRRKWKKAIH